MSLSVLCVLILYFVLPISSSPSSVRAPINPWIASLQADKTTTKTQTRIVAPTLYTLPNVMEAFQTVRFDLLKTPAQDLVVPPLYLSQLPKDLSDIKETAERKAVFFQILLPLVLKINQENMDIRSRVFRLTHRMKLGQQITPQDRLWLETRFTRYGVTPGHFQDLLKKIDRIPPSLVLAQAAEESGWGTSRFAREGNALFGQWTFNPKDKGIVPSGRGDNKTHRIRAFDSLSDSLRAYMFNLNSHDAYIGFREKRAELRRNPSRLTGQRLAATLNQYSERGESYVDSLHTLMRQNNMRRFDLARLGSQDPMTLKSLMEETTARLEPALQGS